MLRNYRILGRVPSILKIPISGRNYWRHLELSANGPPPQWPNGPMVPIGPMKVLWFDTSGVRFLREQFLDIWKRCKTIRYSLKWQIVVWVRLSKMYFPRRVGQNKNKNGFAWRAKSWLPPPVFCPILATPNAHIRQNTKNDRNNTNNKKSNIYIYIYYDIYIYTYMSYIKPH